MIYRDLYFQPKWFDDTNPVNPKKASKVLTISGVVGDTQTVTIGTNVYEFDINDTITQGRTQVDVADLRNQATGTITFGGIPVVTETVVLGGTETYEFVAAAGDVQEGNIAVVLGETLTADNAVIELADAINENSELVTAVASTANDTVIVTSIVKGTAGNSITSTETCTNAGFGGGTLTGGLDTITAINAATALTSAINENETLVTATDGEDGTMTLEYSTVGIAGNSFAIAEGLANGAWASGATVLSGGQYGTPCPIKDIIVYVSPYYYWCEVAGNKDDVSWKRFTPATY